MRFILSVDVEPEAGESLNRVDIAKDLQLYLMDFAQNLPRLDAVDIEGGFHVTGASCRELW
jgi:hypothetical protein